MSVRLLAGPFTPSLNGAPTDVAVTVNLIMWWPGVGLLTSGTVLTEGRQTSPTGVMTMDGRFCDRGDVSLEYPGWWPAKKRLVQYRVGQWVTDGVDHAAEFQHDSFLFVPQPSGPERWPTSHPLYLQSYVKLADRSLIYSPTGEVIDGKYEHSFRVIVNGADVEGEGPPELFRQGRVMPGRSDTDVFVAERGTDPVTGLVNARGVFYDTVTKQWSSPVYNIGMSCNELVFSPEYGVLVSNHREEVAVRAVKRVKRVKREVRPRRPRVRRVRRSGVSFCDDSVG